MSARRLSHVDCSAKLVIGPRNAAAGPSIKRATRVGPRTANVPLRAVSASRANGALSRFATSRPSHRRQSPRPLTRTERGAVKPAILANTPLRGALSDRLSASRLASGTASSLSANRSPPARPSPPIAAACNETNARRLAMRALPSRKATRRSPVTAGSITSRSTLNRPTLMSRSGSSGASLGSVARNSGSRRRDAVAAVRLRISRCLSR